MPDIQASMQRAGHGVLHLALAQCRAARTTAALRVEGRPGGTFHLRRGGVVAVETSGAPGVEALLLRSGRVRADEWAGAASGMPAAELVARGVVGAAELRVLSAMALQDAVFAVVAGRPRAARPRRRRRRSSRRPRGGPLRLLDGAVRRLAALAALPHAVRPDRERVAATGPDLAAAAEGLPPHRREILFLADGRRTARDIAFVVGRGCTR
ncbi:MarR family transcriptional regulator [Streptomyces sp. CC210A]|uniref:MarR family transcriptional regulator n=1 Tax=Streptomyces sp. CC210A TaxID=2898184 RepID=UPI001F3FA285|nr:MarR family transcriptional regulator [Streptomyces sp. CC210A]